VREKRRAGAAGASTPHVAVAPSLILVGAVCLLLLLVTFAAAVSLPIALLYAFPIALATFTAIVAIERARRSQELVARLNERERRHRQLLESMTRVGKELVTSKRWEAIARHLTESLARDLELDAAWMFRSHPGPDGTQLTLLACSGRHPGCDVMQAEGTMAAALSHRVELDAESASDARSRYPAIEPAAVEDGIEARVVLPVFVRGSSSGVVFLGQCGRHAWSDDELSIARATVALLGLAMESASSHRATIDALVRLEEVTQMKSDFLMTVSHELRTPMTVLLGYVDMIEDGTLGKVPRRWEKPIGHIEAKLRELNRVVRMVLEAARVDGPAVDVKLAEVDLASLLEMAVASQEAEAEASRHKLRLLPSPQDSAARCDRDKLLVVVRNLIENAIHYSPPRTRVEVGLKAGRDDVEIFVADRGSGIPGPQKDKIFEQFYRIDRPETRDTSGTGLGLFIVRQLVEVHGGQIGVKDRPGGGSVFTVTIPRDPRVGDRRGGAGAGSLPHSRAAASPG